MLVDSSKNNVIAMTQIRHSGPESETTSNLIRMVDVRPAGLGCSSHSFSCFTETRTFVRTRGRVEMIHTFPVLEVNGRDRMWELTNPL